MTKVSGPPVLRVSHEVVEILLESFKVERLERSSVIEALPERIRHIGMLTKDIKPQCFGPPVLVSGAAASGVHLGNWALLFSHVDVV